MTNDEAPLPKGKEGNSVAREKLLAKLDAIEAADTTARVIIHYKAGEFMKCELALPKVFGKTE